MDRDIDFALMLQVLHVRGFSLADIARKTGTSMSTLSTVKQESKNPPAGWLEAINILDYWLKATGENPPRVGDHIGVDDENDTPTI
jgi:transcriptional regulator with XRE-family HTH domain